MRTATAQDLRVVGYEHSAAQARVIALLQQQHAAAARDDLRAVRLLKAPLLDAQNRYRSTSATLAATADRPLVGAS